MSAERDTRLRAIRERFAEWQIERPESLLRHATVATSQYDAQYRSMAAEILANRAELQSLLSASEAARTQLATDRNKTQDGLEMWHAKFLSMCETYLAESEKLAASEVARTQAEQAVARAYVLAHEWDGRSFFANRQSNYATELRAALSSSTTEAQ